VLIPPHQPTTLKRKSLFFPLTSSFWVSAVPWELYGEGDSLKQSLNYFTCAAMLFNFTVTLKQPDAHLSDITFSRVWSTRIWSAGKPRNQLCMHLFAVSGICMKLSLQLFSNVSTG
jgi:hypothetical protein